MILFEPAKKKAQGSFVFPYSSKSFVFATKIKDGVKTFLFKKELIKIGTFYKDGDVIFEITEETLDHWVDTFDLMVENGIRIPIPKNHWDMDDNNGFVQELFKEDDALCGILEMFGDDIEKLVKTNDVSIFSPPEWVDGEGNLYIRPILHVALTPCPLIPGLKGFEALAASLLSRQEKQMDWSKIKEILGIDEEMSDETAEALVLSAVKGIQGKVAELEGKGKVAKTEVATLQASLETIKASHEGKEPDSFIVQLAADSHQTKIGALVSAGILTPDVSKNLVEAFHGKENKALALSLSHGTVDIFDRVLAALKENTPVKLEEHTKKQTTMELSDPSRGGENAMAVEVKRRQELAKTSA